MPATPLTILRRSKRKFASKPQLEMMEGDEIEGEEAKGNRRKKRPLAKKKRSEAPAERSKEIIGEETLGGGGEEENEDEVQVLEKVESPKQRKGVSARAHKEKGYDEDDDYDVCFLGDPVPEEEARRRWPHRYLTEVAGPKVPNREREEERLLKARMHYVQARVDHSLYQLYDNAYVKAGDGEPHYIGRIVELFETCDNELYFTAQWFFRVQDTVIKDHAHDHDARRVFLSDEKNDNALDCLVKKVRILRTQPKVGLSMKGKEISGFELYYNMSFDVAYSSFTRLPSDDIMDVNGALSIMTDYDPPDAPNDLPTEVVTKEIPNTVSNESPSGIKTELSLLDLFSGCGAMSTGLCLGANLSGVNLKTRWAVDINGHACESLKFNHPEIEVRKEKAEDFLAVLREWQTLCENFEVENEPLSSPMDSSDDEEVEEQVPKGEFEVGKIVGICYGETENIDEAGLKFKVRWKGYGPSEDTWEPINGLSKCKKLIKDFVRRGYKKNILPLPGTVALLCGGPPCQGMSGFNRFREKEDPFKDTKNKQMDIFMQIVEFLKPKFVLMENVVDILKFAKGYLGRYALGQLVSMNYQARLGILAAGNYGLPQYRMRVFLWGAHPAQKLPPFPLPTHDVITRGGPPVEFETHVVAYDGIQQRQLEKALRLSDAISDLPLVENNEGRDEISYEGAPQTDFQHYIRLSREEMIHPSSTTNKPAQDRQLFDHRPLRLNEDDYQRVCRIPKHKGANFRNLPGVVVDSDNKAQWDPDVERVLLPSGKPLVPDYAMSYKDGKSVKPFGRLWWDETVATVVTRAEPHNQIIIHPEQDRVLSVRENARLQGFPDYYKLFGPIKERYIQVGNAVAVPVSRALGYAFGLAYLGKVNEEPALALPQKFPFEL